jgi:thiol-disulfide isomerase/thioredoxin
MRASAWHVLLILGFFSLPTACVRAGPERGGSFPAKDQVLIDASALNGQVVSLTALRGKAVLLSFWATWCRACQEEFPHLQALSNRFESKGLVVIGVNVDDQANGDLVRRFVSDFALTLPVWLAPAAMDATGPGIVGLPTSILIDRSGRERWRHAGLLDPRASGVLQAISEVLRSE